MIIMPAHKPHALKAVTRFKMLLVMIKKKQEVRYEIRDYARCGLGREG
jgi:quercetin dioxygenase-like cupin family protein